MYREREIDRHGWVDGEKGNRETERSTARHTKRSRKTVTIDDTHTHRENLRSKDENVLSAGNSQLEYCKEQQIVRLILHFQRPVNREDKPIWANNN